MTIFFVVFCLKIQRLSFYDSSQHSVTWQLMMIRNVEILSPEHSFQAVDAFAHLLQLKSKFYSPKQNQTTTAPSSVEVLHDDVLLSLFRVHTIRCGATRPLSSTLNVCNDDEKINTKLNSATRCDGNCTIHINNDYPFAVFNRRRESCRKTLLLRTMCERTCVREQ